jgi:hypothetical protein
MTDIVLRSGSSRKLKFAAVDSSGALIDTSTISNIVWVVNSGAREIMRKTFVDNTIILLDEATSKYYISIFHDDTTPDGDSPIGSTTVARQYTHEIRFYFTDGSQEVPESFIGRFTVKPTRTWT